MVKNWDDILTNKQKERLIQEGAKALTKLVNSPEVKDIISEIQISRKKDGKDHHQEIYLTTKGFLEERQRCEGHTYVVDITDDRATEYCENYNKERKIPEKKFRKIVEDYEITDTIISEIIDKLKK